jgi:hypothetical protein
MDAVQQPARRSAGIVQQLPAGADVVEDRGPVTARGVPLTESEWAQLDDLAQQHGGATVTSLLSVLVRIGLHDVQNGKTKLRVKNWRNRKPQFVGFTDD